MISAGGLYELAKAASPILLELLLRMEMRRKLDLGLKDEHTKLSRRLPGGSLPIAWVDVAVGAINARLEGTAIGAASILAMLEVGSYLFKGEKDSNVISLHIAGLVLLAGIFLLGMDAVRTKVCPPDTEGISYRPRSLRWTEGYNSWLRLALFVVPISLKVIELFAS